jgi:hypothetical protein
MKARSTQYDRQPQRRHNSFTTVIVSTAAAGARQRVRHRRGHFHYAREWAALQLSQSAGEVNHIRCMWVK